MFLPVTRQRNPALLATAAELHRRQLIAPDTFVIDVDRVLANARILSAAARQAGLSLYAMTKQTGRNPFVALAAVEGGIRAAVAVDTAEARLLHEHQIPLGNVGHLVQVPVRDVPAVVGMQPEVMTVFSVDAAVRIGQSARAAGREQPLLLRVLDPGDFSYPGQEGGFRVAELPEVAREIGDVAGARVTGVTAFPCLLFDDASNTVEPTPNLASLLRAAELLRRFCGLELSQINAPSATCAATIPFLAAQGATHGEPGSALTGQTPLHAVSCQPELPAMVYVSEVTATRDDLAYCLGGGFYARSRASHALLYPAGQGEPELVEFLQPPADAIDYYGTLCLPAGRRARVGDAVLFAFRSQVFVSRSSVAAVGGIARGRPELLGVCDAAGNLLGAEMLPVGSKEARTQVRRSWEDYLSTVTADSSRGAMPRS